MKSITDIVSRSAAMWHQCITCQQEKGRFHMSFAWGRERDFLAISPPVERRWMLYDEIRYARGRPLYSPTLQPIISTRRGHDDEMMAFNAEARRRKLFCDEKVLETVSPKECACTLDWFLFYHDTKEQSAYRAMKYDALYSKRRDENGEAPIFSSADSDYR